MKFPSSAPIFILIAALGLASPVMAHQNAADSLREVVMAVVDASWDLPNGPHWRDLSGKKAYKACQIVDSQEVVDLVIDGIEQFSSFYIDEDLPYDVALEELDRLAQAGELRLCRDLVLLLPNGLAISLGGNQ